MFSRLPDGYFRGRVFESLADNIETEIRDLLAQEDVGCPDDEDEFFAGVAQAANDAMMIVLVGDIQLREEAA